VHLLTSRARIATLVAPFVIGGVLLTVTAAGAQERDVPIQQNDYDIELYQGPLMAPIRVTGLAGAYTAYAEGVEGTASNAASPAVREPFSHRWLDLDLGFSVSFPGSFARTDFDNRGSRAPRTSSRFDGLLYMNVGAQLQLGRFGASVTSDLQRFTLVPASAGNSGLSLLLGRWHALAAYGFFGGQLAVGAGFRALTLQINESQGSSPAGFVSGTLLTMSGVGPEIGVLYKPDDAPFRLGATVRAPVSGGNPRGSGATTDAGGVIRTAGYVLPRAIVQPWELEAGIALQVGPRPLNPTWIDPHEHEGVRLAIEEARDARTLEYARILADTPERSYLARAAELAARERAIREVEDERIDVEIGTRLAERKARYANWPREKILVVSSVLVTGASADSIAVESFLDQRREPFGRYVTVMPRIGVEAEPLVDWMRVRGGSYIEPSRFDFGTARQHFTGGADVKLFRFDVFGLFDDTVWRASLAIDIAPRYSNWGFGIGAWH
jgi:hypothetical protein